MRGSWLLGIGRVVPYLILTLLIMPVQATALLIGGRIAQRLPVLYHRLASRLLGLEIVVHGTPTGARPTLFVANHTSYFDIEVLGSQIECSFIAKADMINWPLIGWLAKLQRSVFVDRRPVNVSHHASEVAGRLKDGDNLVLFAEGTTSDGNRLLPFKSALFAVAEEAAPERPLTIQPVSVVATALDGMPLGRSLRSIYAWYGDMPMGPHLWQALTAGQITVTVEFHEPFVAHGFTRKQLAQRCEQAVRAGFVRAITGRYPALEPGPLPSGQRDTPNESHGDRIDAAA